MEATLETTSGLERRMRITVPAEQLDSQVEAKLKQTAGQARIKGFRPGKVPLREVRRRFGEGIRQEVGSEIMQTSFAEAIREKEVSPAGMPRIEDIKIESGQDLEFTAIFEVFPDVEVAGFESITVEKPIAEVTEADIDKMIDTLREQRKHYHETDRAAQDGDQVNLDFDGYIDGEAFEGGKAEGSELVIGSGQMIVGFEDGLIGLSKGDEKDLEVTFPEQYQSSELAGKAAIFKVVINSVSESHLPELNDEFFKEFGVEEGGPPAFRTEVKSNMTKELDAAISNKVRTQVMDGLIATNTVALPQALVDQEIDRMRQEAVQQFGGGNNSIDPSMLPAEMFSEQANRRVSLGLIVNAIVEQHELKLDDERVKARIESMASSYEDPAQVVQYYYGNEQYLGQIQNLVLEEQVVDCILDAANVTEKSVTYDEAIKPAPAVPAADPAVDSEAADGETGEGETEPST